MAIFVRGRGAQEDDRESTLLGLLFLALLLAVMAITDTYRIAKNF